MADIDLSSIRTTEDIINVLSILYFNLNEIERNFYDIFLNPKNMIINLQRYNDLGVLDVVPVKNLASLQTTALTGSGSPNGEVTAEVGKFYIDTSEYNLYFKSSGSDSQGWVLLWSGLNLKQPGGQTGTSATFLPPNGNGGQLTNLNASNIGSGILSVIRGGTGSANITGIVRGNGTSAMSAAEDGNDYMGPESMVGIIAYYPNNNIPVGWLRCDGSSYSRTTYERLFNKIGNTYGAVDGEHFNVPDLYNHFIRCWDGNPDVPFNTVQEAQVGTHRHGLNGSTSGGTAHTHSKGSYRIAGTGIFSSTRLTKLVANGGISDSGKYYRNFYSGAIGMPNKQVSALGLGNIGADNTYNCRAEKFPDVSDDPQGSNGGLVVLDTDMGGWTGVSGSESAHTHSLSGLNTNYNVGDSTDMYENRVLNKMLVPVIKF